MGGSIATSSCGSNVVESPGGAGGTTTGSTSTTTGSTSTTSTSTGALLGHWMQQTIGDCINGEEWWTFGPGTTFTHTQVDRNFCGPHGVTPSAGDFSDDGTQATVGWGDAGTKEGRRFTYAVVDPHPSPPPPAYPGYVTGARALNVAAYRVSADGITYVRESDRESSDPNGAYTTTVAVTVTLDAPLPADSSTTACTMHVTVVASASPAQSSKPSSGQETFDFPCHAGPTQTSLFFWVTADGWDIYGSGWYDLLKSKGVYDKYDTVVISVFESSFRPVLYYVPGKPDALFHDDTSAWYFEMLSPPPDHVD